MVDRSFYFDPKARGSAVFLGPTESRLMELAWEKKKLTVKSALLYLGPKNRLAYTTVMTVMARLAKKGVLNRRRDGRSFVYVPAESRKQFMETRIKQVKNCLKELS